MEFYMGRTLGNTLVNLGIQLMRARCSSGCTVTSWLVVVAASRLMFSMARRITRTAIIWNFVMLHLSMILCKIWYHLISSKQRISASNLEACIYPKVLITWTLILARYNDIRLYPSHTHTNTYKKIGERILAHVGNGYIMFDTYVFFEI